MTSSPLSGIKVLDLSWVMVGPMTVRYLADLGADVIKVESTTRLDPLRSLGPFKTTPNARNSLSYQFINAGKRSIAIDLQRPEGRALLLELVAQVDVLVQSYTPGVMERLGLDEETLLAANPKLVYASTSVFGSSGARAKTSGVGTTGAAYSGASALVGWPDRPPTGPFGPWTDAVAPRYLAASILAALRRVRAGGAGGRIDVAQAEAGLQFVLPEYLSFVLNGRVPQRRGSQLSTTRSPSNVYPCEGPDSWIAIDVADAQQWADFADLVGAELNDERFGTLIGRLRHREALDRIIGEWTTSQTASDVENLLQAKEIPAHVVSTGAQLHDDPDLAAEDYFVPQHSDDIGDYAIRRAQWEISPAAAVLPKPAPATGESTRDVLINTFGYSASAVDELTAAEILR